MLVFEVFISLNKTITDLLGISLTLINIRGILTISRFSLTYFAKFRLNRYCVPWDHAKPLHILVQGK